MANQPPSKRFSPTSRMERWIPVILVLLAFVLIVTIAIVVLAVLGLIPGV